MALFSLFARLGLDSSAFEGGLKRSQSLAIGFGRDFKATIASAFTAGAVASWSTRLLGAADNIRDLSEQLGITNQEVQELNYLADESGVAFDRYAAALNKITGARAEALAGNDKLQSKFEKFGVTMTMLGDQSVRSMDILKTIGGAIGELTPQKQADLLDLMGDKSARLLTAVKELHLLGPIPLISDDQLDRLDRVNRKVNEFKRERDVYGSNMLGSLIEKYEQNAKGRNGVMRLLGVGAAGLDVASEFIANAFSSTLEPDRKVSRANLEDALKAREAKRAAGMTNPRDVEDMLFEVATTFNEKHKAKVSTSKASKTDMFRSSAEGGLQSQGGYWFGAEASAKQDLVAIRQELVAIKTSINRVANQ